MRKLAQNDIYIELHVPSFDRVKDFYGKLGFQVAWEKKPENRNGYLVMKRDNSILCFYAGNEHVYGQSYFKNFSRDTKRGYAVEICIIVEDIEKFYNNVKTFTKVIEELQLKPWGLKDFRIEDPFGFYLRFSEPHNILIP
ncbi:MAG: hypothetical protein COX92_01120 [Candidatus Nealsonbacteria bacterium CG_4_10_14_0_2_um_filter_40_15]|uniref:VOC domain-containing protein n=2 Tax=Candidatus Nealsoniibacteriota TaxID=1817911 RepID=A0A2M7D875_9BACT|nr:MAG: hypothetical protein COS26_01045 [Candidatus Nealsonbacteria bacterium CG02_land_8_20_14_3_00_40_11]PIZ87474.1 MAG: hypothetical protein COX92_01120 [Candidatus Nealsonbacteria bacterium CG_4_10_14_0_2_um_filter_40_15]